jgi:hypothetical protein
METVPDNFFGAEEEVIPVEDLVEMVEEQKAVPTKPDPPENPASKRGRPPKKASKPSTPPHRPVKTSAKDSTHRPAQGEREMKRERARIRRVPVRYHREPRMREPPPAYSYYYYDDYPASDSGYGDASDEEIQRRSPSPRMIRRHRSRYSPDYPPFHSPSDHKRRRK